MRQQSKIQVTVGDAVIGGSKPLICLSLVGAAKEEIIKEAGLLVAMEPDLLEWRVDAYDKVENIGDCLTVLKELRTNICEIPLIFTCRIDSEGGIAKISRQKRLELITAAIETGDVEIVDIELCNDAEFVEEIRNIAILHGVKLIFSYHNFKETPSESFIYQKLVEAQTAGADISKLAVMPKTYQDVLTLLSATNKARNGEVHGPIVTMSMGEEGAVSRLAGGLFGSDITFAVGVKSSAPGQIPIKDLKESMVVLFRSE